MEITSAPDENWQVLLSLFPKQWKEYASETGAMTSKFRNFASEEAVMRTLLLHITKGYSLRETVVRAKAAGIADVSDVALLKRLRLSENWLKVLCQDLLSESGFSKKTNEQSDIQMKLVDATNVKEPGKTGSLWRIHYSLVLPKLQCDYFCLTTTEGKGNGESYKQFPVKKGDCVIGDRGYSTAAGIEHLDNVGAYSLLRVNTNSLCFYLKNEKRVSLLSKVKNLQTSGKVGEWKVWVKKTDGSFVEGRICAVRKSEFAIERSLKRLKQKSSKKQFMLRPETLEFAKYVIVFTTLPAEDYSPLSILEWYRLRWQIELIFKRLKSLAGLGHLPKYDDVSSRAWLYGKLFAGLLVEKLIHYTNNISPWGYSLANK